jgi:c-di-GMP-binding flagellar brake protein YcgR
MAIPIKRIEKDFFLKVVYDEQIPVIYLGNRVEYSLTLEKPATAEIYLKSKQSIPELKKIRKIYLMFNWLGQVISFCTEIISFRNEHIVAKAPEFLYKNLDRSYSRILSPQEIQLQLLEAGRKKNEFFDGKLIDISASGILFAYPRPILSSLLGPKSSELSITIVTPHRSVTPNIKIVRRYKDQVQSYFGCCFLDMAPEDTRYLFEFIYGRPFTDSDAVFLSGQV